MVRCILVLLSIGLCLADNYGGYSEQQLDLPDRPRHMIDPPRPPIDFQRPPIDPPRLPLVLPEPLFFPKPVPNSYGSLEIVGPPGIRQLNEPLPQVFPEMPRPLQPQPFLIRPEVSYKKDHYRIEQKMNEPIEIFQPKIFKPELELGKEKKYGYKNEIFYPAKIPVTEIDCKILEDGQYPHPTKSCHFEFFTCTNGLGERLTCPDGLFYHSGEKACEIYAYVPACSGKERPPNEPTMPTILAYTAPPPVDCSGRLDGPVPDPVGRCSQTWYACSGGVTKTMTCDSELWYNYATDACEGYLSACEGRISKPKQEEIIPLKQVPIDCESLATGHYPDPFSQCSDHYYQCSHGIGYEMPCPPNSYYDVEYEVCGSYDSIPACSGKPRPVHEEQKINDFIPKPFYPFDCSKYDDDYYPAGDCEGFYWSCSGGQTDKIDCPPKLKFDPMTKQCAHKTEIPSCGGAYTTAAPQLDAIPQPTPAPVDFNCLDLADGNYVNPKDQCGSIYYSCSGGRALERKCYEKLAYNPVEDICETPAKITACKINLPARDTISVGYRKLTYTTPLIRDMPLKHEETFIRPFEIQPQIVVRPIETRRPILESYGANTYAPRDTPVFQPLMIVSPPKPVKHYESLNLDTPVKPMVHPTPMLKPLAHPLQRIHDQPMFPEIKIHKYSENY